jgi:hypothetical protein
MSLQSLRSNKTALRQSTLRFMKGRKDVTAFVLQVIFIFIFVAIYIYSILPQGNMKRSDVAFCFMLQPGTLT